MKRIIAGIHFLFLLLLAISLLFGQPEQQQGNAGKKPNWKKVAHQSQIGEIRLEIEKLLDEKKNPDHGYIDVYLSRQNSILWTSKQHEFKILFQPINEDGTPIGDPGENPPFYKTGDELKSRHKVLSSGPPRDQLNKPGQGETDIVLHYDMIIKLLNDQGEEISEMDPHTAVHTRY